MQPFSKPNFFLTVASLGKEPRTCKPDCNSQSISLSVRKTRYFAEEKETIQVAELTVLVDDERAVDGVYLEFSKPFNHVSHNLLIDKLIR